jgi:hypothetical protein
MTSGAAQARPSCLSKRICRIAQRDSGAWQIMDDKLATLWFNQRVFILSRWVGKAVGPEGLTYYAYRLLAR